MSIILSAVSFVSGLGSAVMMAIVVAVLGIAFGQKPGVAIRGGLTVGVGLIGITTVFGLLGANLGPATQAMVENYGFALEIIDVGWPASSAIAMATSIGALVIPLGLAVNIVMLLTNSTQTVNVDIWNYWHYAFTGALVTGVTGNAAYGFIAAAANIVIVMVIGDLTAPAVAKYNGLEGISIPHGFSAAFVPLAWVTDKIIDSIPGLKDVDINFEKIQSKFGVLGEPILIGTVIGVVIGLFAGYGTASLALGITLGAVLVLTPKMAAMLMEGLLPLSDSASTFISTKFSKRGKMYIGLDSAVGVGNPTTIALSLILVPLTLILALILPGNRVLPFGDLATLPYMFVLILPICKNNGFRAFIVGLVSLASGLYIATDLAELHTMMAVEAGFDTSGAALISSICDGGNPLTWFVTTVSKMNTAGIGILVVIAVVIAFLNRQRIVKEAKAMHEAE
ncbi:PTS galactitol transporter subunit IIC [Chakrabartyella piscis]|uniref:PTS galactitol transporter subunit IIC n=1 Tax=Chakrabartyella piscis TaxID=2918914 RepID=UPI0029587089|nr:PTS transporter subunit IIC [Chakrabartyella piscis]